MTNKHETAITALARHCQEKNLEIIQQLEISNARRFRVSDGMNICPVDIFYTGSIVVGGKKTVTLYQQLQEWKNLFLAGMTVTTDAADLDNRVTSYAVATHKYDKIRKDLEQVEAEIDWLENPSGIGQVYRAVLQKNGQKVTITQFRTNKLLVQGKASALFDEVCQILDTKLAQSAADRATRYIPEQQSASALAHMQRADAEKEAWEWLGRRLDDETISFLSELDQHMLVAGAILIQAAEAKKLTLPEYSPLVMPFARAYEGFLITLFIQIGLADADKIAKNFKSIQVGNWLNQLSELIVDGSHAHLVDDMKTAWNGTRHLMMHSDFMRQIRIPTVEKAYDEICGSVLRAIDRGYQHFVKHPIALHPFSNKTFAPPDSKKEIRLKTLMKVL